jgi:hypothetical protein
MPKNGPPADDNPESRAPAPKVGASEPKPYVSMQALVTPDAKKSSQSPWTPQCLNSF